MELTKEQVSWFDHIDTIMGDNEQHDYDLTDRKQYELAHFMAKVQSKHLGTTGHIAHLEMARQSQQDGAKAVTLDACIPENLQNSGWTNLIMIPGLGFDDSQNVLTSDGFGTVVGGFTVMNLQLIIKDNTTNRIVASGANNAFSAETLGVQTLPIGSGSSSRSVTSYLSYSFQLPSNASDNAAPLQTSGLVKRSSINGNTTGDPIVLAPVRTTSAPLNPNAINIGIGRHWTDQGGSTQFDYAWNESPNLPPVGKMPFKGSVTFQYPIADITPNTGLLLRIYVANKTGGGASPPLDATNLAHIYSKFQIDPTDNKTLKWDLPPGVSTNDPGDPIVFGNVPWPTDIEAYFYCGMFVALNGTDEPGIASVQSKIAPDQNLLNGNKEIMPIEFIWHCLSGDTEVLMADGRTEPIKNLVMGDRVMNRDGVVTDVLWTTKGIHIGELLEIRLDNGTTLTCSDHHIIAAERGYLPANELTQEDNVLCIDGSHGIKSINTIDNNPQALYNLGLSEWFDGKDVSGVATFVANGMFVGDVNAQKAARALKRARPEWLKSRVADYYHDDVDRYLETLRKNHSNN